ncbi:WXG100 family type VII secretion target [Kitasatospora mediocidica]|uniref:WXG100 family type VII secretion target n=1 Tax=Kitasatospora mediocidica TaxID=58352 RepID=UPI0005601597|nr:WXG100 family type VII secretion target [Kitasatospora mediocidica]
MADLTLHHETVDQAVQELQAAGNTMKSDLDHLVQVLTPLQEHFQGAAATAFTEFLAAVNQNEQQMTDDIAAAAACLDSMHQTMTHADNQAAAGYSH